MKYGNPNNFLFGVMLPLSPCINSCVVAQTFTSEDENYYKHGLLALHTA